MAIPDYQEIMLPLLRALVDGSVHGLTDVRNGLTVYFSLTEEEVREVLPSGRSRRFDNRVGWARTYLKKAGLLEYATRGHVKSTDRGRAALAESPDSIDNEYLMRFPEFKEFRSRPSKDMTMPAGDVHVKDARLLVGPEEIIESQLEVLNTKLGDELLETIESMSSDFFEKLVVDLLLKMGYGGSRKDAGLAVGGTGDTGIDGIIKQDRLGLDKIYVQAKRWTTNNVSRPDVQKFAGSLDMHYANKGVFITTAEFTQGAMEFAHSIQKSIILIGRTRLSELMIEFGLGISKVASYEISQIDSDYFVEE